MLKSEDHMFAGTDFASPDFDVEGFPIGKSQPAEVETPEDLAAGGSRRTSHYTTSDSS